MRDHIKKLKVPYTFIDVGWWYQFAFPRVPSGKLDYAATAKKDLIAGDGSVKSALTDKRGQYLQLSVMRTLGLRSRHLCPVTLGSGTGS